MNGPFQQFSSKSVEEDTNSMTNFHEFQHLYEPQSTARRGRVCHCWGNIRWRGAIPLFRARATHHLLLTRTSDRGVRRRRGGQLADICEYKCKPQFAQISSSTSCQRCDPLYTPTYRVLYTQQQIQNQSRTNRETCQS